MPDLDLSVTVSRALLGLDDLQLNDHDAYAISRDTSASFLGGSEGWERNQVGGPWVDGMLTVNRQRQMVEEPVSVFVYGSTLAALTANVAAVRAAFRQSYFTLTVKLAGVDVGQYACEAADMQRTTTGYQWMSTMEAWTFTVPRQPVMLGGPV